MADYVTGAKELMAKLEKLDKVTAKRALRKGTRAGAKQIAATARTIAPRRTGALASTIKVRALKRSRKAVGTRVDLTIRYGSFVELGSIRNPHPAEMLRKAMRQDGPAAQ